MNFINMIKKYAKIRNSVVLILVGLIISIIAGVMFIAPDNNTYEKVEATITSIEEIEDTDQSETDTNYAVYVKYTVDEKEYKAQLNGYQSNWKVGKVIECEYNVDDPASLRTGNGKTMSLIICLIGICAVIYGVFSLTKGIKASSKDFAQYDKIEESQIDTVKAEEIKIIHYVQHAWKQYF